ncbi:NADH-quinone oxidoreductase subunit NuoG [Candidatus Finniella inopinata]|uniref:NADH-quinone oxidoreductase n=1 Tax=Candidatus Finniella inopinata TaxID=1696036 RepID=A0A4Q7DJG1_9PROT|nr:NADH-quinone oxidoreductase subunit NuoG [Candidatus Finniella inopinata]RZI46458.1 NADH-quinone oxidoreductase subunit G [Candidatus Finniella inopinata]
MTKITLNNEPLEVEAGTTIFQACQQQGLEVPHFCYHPKLSVAGNCRMCLVEVAGSPKPVASCTMPVSEGMVIHTDTPMVEKSRQGVLELLLINHPLDCPVCDQGGECDLQDLTMNYGRSHSRFEFEKRIVTDKYMGPLIKTVMTRCIQCTRCIRFADEIAGVPELIAIGRGETMEIVNSLDTAIQSELSGNMIDICPVGALTDKPFAFKGRSWEWTKTDVIDVMDALGSHIQVHSRDREVMRILPRVCEDINEEWLSDRSRFAYDGLKYQRLDTPYIRVDGQLQACSWESAFQPIADRLETLKGKEIAALAGDLADCESMLALKILWQQLESPHLDCRQDATFLPHEHRSHYILNTPIADFEKADCVLLIGTNPRHEAPLLNARLRKAYRNHQTTFGLVGQAVDLTYPYEFMGNQPESLTALLDASHPFTQRLATAKKPVVILGQAVFTRPDAPALLNTIQKLFELYPLLEYNVLHTAASRVGGVDVGFVPQRNGLNSREILAACQSGEIKFLYLLGADDIAPTQLGQAFVVYQGHHGDAAAARADVILPGCAYTEKTATYVNTEGRAQRSHQAVPPPGQAKEDWKIITSLSHALGKPLPYITHADVVQELQNCHPTFQYLGTLVKNIWHPLPQTSKASFDPTPLQPLINNFYMTNIITRHSPTMAACVQEIIQGRKPDKTF